MDRCICSTTCIHFSNRGLKRMLQNLVYLWNCQQNKVKFIGNLIFFVILSGTFRWVILWLPVLLITPKKSFHCSVLELFKPPKPCFMGNGSMLILKAMPDVSSTPCLLCFTCDSNPEVWWNPFWMVIIRVMSWNIHVIYGTCEHYVCYCSKNKKDLSLVSLKYPQKK